MKVLRLNEFKINETMLASGNDFEVGVWHGEDATVLYKDPDAVTFIVGSYPEAELQKICKLFDEDSPALSKYDDYIFTVDTEEWDEQNY